MKLTALTISWSAKVGLANYSHIQAGTELTFEIEETDDERLALPLALSIAKAAIKETLRQKAGERTPLADAARKALGE